MKRLIITFALLTITTMAFSQSVIIKDGETSPNTLLEINDEGKAGSITLPSTATPTESKYKLYNEDGTLIWNGNPLTIGGSAVWSLNISNAYYTAGNVGIGTSTPTHLLEVIGSAQGNAIGHFVNTNTATENGIGVFGSSSTTAGYGIGGDFVGGDIGARGSGQNFGIYGTVSGTSGQGVHGIASNINGTTNYGGYFVARGTKGVGVYGYGYAASIGTVTNYGGYFKANGQFGRGVYGNASNTGEGTNYGGYFEAKGTTGRGVYGSADNTGAVTNYGGYFEAKGTYGYGVYGTTSGAAGVGVSGFASGKNGRAVSGYATGISSTGVYGHGELYAGQFDGNVSVTGSVSKSSGSFKIDHPLDPENKYLSHSFVESPDMMNIYNGNVVTNSNGEAIVVLPDYFESLNMDFRYQLTVIGEFAQAIVSDEISNGRFLIRTDKPNVKVSWQVTGIRQDVYANAHRIKVEENKETKDIGKYLHPEEFGMPREMSINYSLE